MNLVESTIHMIVVKIKSLFYCWRFSCPVLFSCIMNVIVRVHDSISCFVPLYYNVAKKHDVLFFYVIIIINIRDTIITTKNRF